MKFFRLFAAAALLLAAGSVYAQEATPFVEPPAEATTEIVPYAPPTPLPAEARLTGLRPVYQQFNRCSAAALTIQLSYFGWQGTYDDTIRALNPDAEDVAVRLDEMAAFAEQQGLKAVYRIGGTLDLLKALVAGGFPVLMENVYYDGPGAFQDWMAHNRIVMGYDDAKQEIYTFDSLLGNGENNSGRPMAYADVDDRWRPFNRDFLVLYRPEEEAAVQQIMANYWDETYAAQVALQFSQQELDAGTSDSFTLFNMGSSLVELDRFPEAADAFDRARQIGLPWRMMWYQYAPYDAYYEVGRYEDMLTIAREVIATTPGVEESFYYAGLAYQGEGDIERARSNYQVALIRNNSFALAQSALASIGG
ncbi:MAG: C39 family peptidase [Chloroflexota bacterium]